MQGLLDKLEVIECFERPGERIRFGEILEKQKRIYEALGVPPPVSLLVEGKAGYYRREAAPRTSQRAMQVCCICKLKL